MQCRLRSRASECVFARASAVAAAAIEIVVPSHENELAFPAPASLMMSNISLSLVLMCVSLARRAFALWQVHDEIILEGPEKEAQQAFDIVKERMEKPFAPRKVRVSCCPVREFEGVCVCVCALARSLARSLALASKD